MNLNLKIKKISLHGADYLKATMKGESCSGQLVTSSKARVHWEHTGHRLNQILSMKVTGFSLHVAATTAAEQRNLGYKRAHRCRSHMLHLTALRIHTCFTWDYQWGGIKGKAANPESLILIGLCKAFMSVLLSNLQNALLLYQLHVTSVLSLVMSLHKADPDKKVLLPLNKHICKCLQLNQNKPNTLSLLRC